MILNKTNFENEVLKAKGISLIDFYADWCGPCKMLAPVITEIEKERTDINIGKVNVSDEPDLANAYHVMSIPTLILFKDGKELTRSVGYKSKQEILSLLP